jgi:hypothetical protein
MIKVVVSNACAEASVLELSPDAIEWVAAGIANLFMLTCLGLVMFWLCRSEAAARRRPVVRRYVSDESADRAAPGTEPVLPAAQATGRSMAPDRAVQIVV